MSKDPAVSSVTTSIPRPEKFSGHCDIKIWYQQFELFLTLSKTDVSIHRDVLLSYLELPIFQAVLTAIEEKSRTYEKVKEFLIKRYSVTDDYIDRLAFFETKYFGPAEKFAGTLNNLFDLFTSTNLKEEILVARFISSTTDKLSKELRLRRPSTLSECVQIANSMPAPISQTCTISKSKVNYSPNHSTTVCFCCGRPGHNYKAKDRKCPARSAVCRNCLKSGHFASVCKSSKIDKGNHIKVGTITFAEVHSKTLPGILQNPVSRPC